MSNLWEHDHPYYANEGNFYATGCHEWYTSWAEFLAARGDADLDYNLLYRWDWNVPDPADYTEGEDMPDEQVRLYFMQQRKAKCASVYVQVTREDEPLVREWLAIRARHMIALWAPLLDLVEEVDPVDEKTAVFAMRAVERLVDDAAHTWGTVCTDCMDAGRAGAAGPMMTETAPLRNVIRIYKEATS